MHVHEFQKLIEGLYLQKDRERGIEASFLWFVEEVGELARAIRHGNDRQLEEEFGDCLAWLSSLASLKGIQLDNAIQQFTKGGCPDCQATPCQC